MEAELFSRRRTDSGAEPGQVEGFIGPDFETECRRIDEDETIATVGGVDGQRADPFDFEGSVKLIGKRGYRL